MSGRTVRRVGLVALGVALSVVFLAVEVDARGRFGGGGRGGGGRMGGSHMSRGGGGFGGGAGVSRGGFNRGSLGGRAGSGGYRGGATRPSTRPAVSPGTSRPSDRPTTQPSRPGGGDRPTTKPDRPGEGERPGSGDRDPGDRQEDRQDWRDENREDWQSHQRGMQEDRQEFYEDNSWHHGYYGYRSGATVAALWTGLVIGSMYASLPPRYETVYVVGVPYYYSEGNYYEQSGDQYKVVAPPIGATVSSIPEGAKKETVGDKTYFVVGETYYQAFYSGGSAVYKVVEKP